MLMFHQVNPAISPLLSCFAALFVAISTESCTTRSAPRRAMNTLAEMHLRGHVSAITESSYSDSSQHDSTLRWHIVYTFDSMGNLKLKNSCYYDDPEPDTTHLVATYFYNSMGRVVRDSVHLSDGTPSYNEYYSYDSAGRRSSLHAFNGRALFLYTYDAQNRLVAMRDSNKDNGYTVDYTYTRDSVGNTISEHKYLTDYRSYYNHLLSHEYYRYDTNSNLLRRSNCDINNPGQGDKDRANCFDYTYRYQFDANGNWIKQTEYDRGRLKSVTIRAITYR